MPSTRRSEASRRNGAKSRGPKTPAGLAKSSRNSLAHGFTCRSTLILQCENPREFEQLIAEYRATYNPETLAEVDLVEQMVAARWRLRRLWTIETALLDAEIVRRQPDMEKQFKHIDPTVELALAFRYLADDSRSLALVSRYESRLSRMHDRAYIALRELQTARQDQKMRNEPTESERVSDLNPLPGRPARAAASNVPPAADSWAVSPTAGQADRIPPTRRALPSPSPASESIAAGRPSGIAD